jgi:tetratricopeptide (TPR) repeat protein
MAEAAAAFKIGDIEQCININKTLFSSEISCLELEHNRNWMKLASAHINTAFAFKLLGKFESGATEVEAGIQLLESHYSQAKPEISHAYDLATELEISRNNLGRAQALADKALELKTKIYNKLELPLAHSLNLQGAIHLAQGALDAAQVDFKKSLVVNVANFGLARPLHQQTAVTLSNLAGVFRTRGQHGEAAQIYEVVVTSFTAHLGEGSWIAAQAAFDLGVSLALIGEKSRATEVLVDAVSRFMTARGPEHPATLGVMEFLKNLDKVEVPEGHDSRVDLVDELLNEAEREVKVLKGSAGVQGDVHVIDRRGHVGHGHPLFTPLK